jgi:Xaa-Pro aminopeptidase
LNTDLLLNPASSQLYLDRIERLQRALKGAAGDACLIEQPLDLFYFTGLKLSSGKLIVKADHTLLLVDGRYLQMAKERSPFPSSLDTVEAWAVFCKTHHVKQLLADGRHTSHEHFLHLQKVDSAISLVSSPSFFKCMRLVKDSQEIAVMRKSAALLWKGFEWVSSHLKSGVTEKELSKRFKIFCLENGAEGFSFEPIIAFGKNSAMPHYRSQDVPLNEGDSVLIDIGIVYEGYHSDMTRVLFFEHKDLYLGKLYEIAKKAQRSALQECRPGTRVGQLDLAARRVFKEEGVEELFVHSLGHGIGLEVHESPRIRWDGEDKDVILESGMVLTVEPGLYVPGVGGVRYEDTILITATGYENFYAGDL